MNGVSERFLVIIKLREESYGGSSEEAAYMLVDQVIPSLEMMERMEREGKVTGGFFIGQTGGMFIFNVKDDMELDRILASLSMMNVYDIEIAPLQSISSALERDRRIVDEVRMAAGINVQK
jgi:muconolactone delta-isomerase